MMSRKQRGSFSKTKVPINLLPVRRNSKISDHNPDLMITSPHNNRHDFMDGDRFNQKTPDKQRVHRRISI